MIFIKSQPLLRESLDWPDSSSENEWFGHKGTSAGLTPTDDPISTPRGQAIQSSMVISTSGNGKGVKKMSSVCLDQKDFCEEPKG